MNQEQAFLADVIEHPDDDSLRLIFADWLDDHDQPERAEFIRAQIESDHTDVYDPKAAELADREAVLLGRHQTKWLARLRSHLAEWTFRRGLLDEVTVRVEVLLKKAKQLAEHPIRTMALRFEPGDVDRVDRVADCPALATVQTLALACGSGMTATALARLGASRCLGRLKHLDLSLANLTPDGVPALAGSPLVRHLESLNLSDNPVGAAGAEALARGDAERLKVLHLSDAKLGKAGIEALTGTRRLPMLRSLDLSENGLTGAAARALAGCPRLAELRWLNLSRNRIGRDGAGALARSPHVRKLERLLLLSNGLGAGGAAELGEAGFLDSIQQLELAGNNLGEAGLRSILKSRPARLQFLLLGSNELDDDALRLLARWPALASVRELNLYNNRVTAFGMRAIVDSPHAKSVCRMNLESNKLGDMGAEVLARWPGLAGMRWLKLRRNGISEKGAMALARSAHLHYLSDLDLSSNDVEGAREALTTSTVRERIRRVAPWDVAEIDYHAPFTRERPRG